MKIIKETTNLNLSKKLESTWPLGKVLLFDIETTGLKKETTYVYLIGCAYFENGNWQLNQYLACSALDEREVIKEFLDLASNFDVLVHFNGDRFDIPYIAYKAQYYGFNFDFGKFDSFDIYAHAKCLKKIINAEKMSQKSIEEFLNIHRDDKYDGGRLIPIYYEYEQTFDEKLEELLLLHNHDDIEGMFKIMPILNYLDIIEGNFVFESYEEYQNTLILNFTLPNKIVREFENKIFDGVNLFAKDYLLQINIDIFEGEGKLPICDIENYYYLPDEDKVVHKSVAEFVDRAHKKKATKKNCYLKKHGKFLPQKNCLFEPSFYVFDNKKYTYFEYNDKIINNKDILVHYVLDFIN